MGVDAVDRKLLSPVWVRRQSMSCGELNHLSETRSNYTRYPTREFTPKATRLPHQCASSIGQFGGEQVPNNCSPIISEVKENYTSPRRPATTKNARKGRQMCRRKDVLQMAPKWVRLDDESLYESSFKGISVPPAIRVQPADEGINGLETAFQRSKRSNQLGHVVYTTPDYPPRSMYRNDFRRPCDITTEDTFNEVISDQIYPIQTDGSHNFTTEVRDNYHSWVQPPSAPNLSIRDGRDWKPKPAVYLPEDPATLAPMESSTTYKRDFVRLNRESRGQASCATRSEIAQAGLLNSFNGVRETMPRTLYRDSFVGMDGADRWADRQVRQNISSFIHRTGPPQTDDTIYWKGVPTEPYTDYKKAMFGRLGRAQRVTT